MSKLIISFMIISLLLVGCYQNTDVMEDKEVGNEIIEDEDQDLIVEEAVVDITEDADKIFDFMQSEIQVNEGQRFIIQFDPNKEEGLEWVLKEQTAEGLDLEKKSGNQWLFQSKAIGEYFLEFELIDISTKEAAEIQLVHVFVQNSKTTLGNIFEIDGVFQDSENQMIKITDEMKEYQIYVPDKKVIEEFENGDGVIAGIEVGETAYILRILESSIRPIDGPSGKEVITHIGKIEMAGDMRLGLLINDYYLEMFDNDLVNNNYGVGEYVMVKYIANHDTESNELIFIQKVE